MILSSDGLRSIPKMLGDLTEASDLYIRAIVETHYLPNFISVLL